MQVKTWFVDKWAELKNRTNKPRTLNIQTEIPIIRGKKTVERKEGEEQDALKAKEIGANDSP